MVEFETPEQAQQAIAMFNGQQVRAVRRNELRSLQCSCHGLLCAELVEL